MFERLTSEGVAIDHEEFLGVEGEQSAFECERFADGHAVVWVRERKGQYATVELSAEVVEMLANVLTGEWSEPIPPQPARWQVRARDRHPAARSDRRFDPHQYETRAEAERRANEVNKSSADRWSNAYVCRV